MKYTVSLSGIARLLCAAAVVGAMLPDPARGSDSAPDCESYARSAGARAGLPDGLLAAVARVESGHKGRAWPWTLNQGGTGGYFASKTAALQALDEILSQGISNVDLGCMQINWRWHSAKFPDASAMMDPATNTEYAAAYLSALYESRGSWEEAVAFYHSRDPDRGARYARKVMAVLERMGTASGGSEEDAPKADTLARADPDSAAGAVQAQAAMVRGLLVTSGGVLVADNRATDLRAGAGRGFLSR